MRKGSLSKAVSLALSASLLLGNLTICGVSVANAEGRTSQVSSIVAEGKEAPFPPSGFYVTTDETTLTATWDAVSEATGYKVFIDDKLVYSGSDLTYKATELTPDKTYVVELVSFNSAGESGRLRHTSKTKDPALMPAPTNIKAETTSNSATISWDAVEGANHYWVIFNNDLVYSGPNLTTVAKNLGSDRPYTVYVHGIKMAGTVVKEKGEQGYVNIVTKAEAKVEAPESEHNNNFSDISGSFAEEAIKSLTKEGFLKGYEDGTFGPNKKISRAEFTILAKRALGLENKSASDVQALKDLNKNAWYTEELLVALSNGLTNGYDDGTFRPNLIMQREQAAVMLANVLVKNNFEPKTEEKDFADNNIAPWAKSSIHLLQSYKIVEGQNNFFYPKREVTRAEAAVMIYRLLDVLNK
jgi:hypothetical protein